MASSPHKLIKQEVGKSLFFDVGTVVSIEFSPVV